MRDSSKKEIKNSLFIFISFAIVSLLFSPYHCLLPSTFTADDASYVAHAFTLGLDFNLKYENSIADWISPNGITPIHPVGMGVLSAPFVAIFSLLDRAVSATVISQHQTFQYSWSYFGVVFSTCFYFLMGIFFYINAFKDLYKVKYNQIVLLCCGFGVTYYVLYRPTMSHAYEFFCLALMVWSTIKLLNKQFLCFDKISRYLVLTSLPFSMVMSLCIRPSNYHVFLLPFIVFFLVKLSKKISFSKEELITLYKNIIISGVFFIIFVTLYGMYSYSTYGVFIPTYESMYGHAGTNTAITLPVVHSFSDLISLFKVILWRLPKLWILCFSSEFGLLYTAPIFLFGTLMVLHFLAKQSKQNTRESILAGGMVLMYLGFPVAIVLLWQSCASSYGYRFLFTLFPVTLLGFLIWNENSQASKTKKIIKALLFILSVNAILSCAFFGINDKLKYQETEYNSFGVKEASAIGYNIAVLEAQFSYREWTKLFLIRTPGFFATYFIDKVPEKLPVSDVLKVKIEKMIENKPPIQSYFQAFLIVLFFVWGLYNIRKFSGIYHCK